MTPVKFKEILYLNSPTRNGRIYTKECFKDINYPVRIGDVSTIEYDGVMPEKYFGDITSIDVNDDYIVLNGEFHDKSKVLDEYVCVPFGLGKMKCDNDKTYVCDYKLLCFSYTKNPAMECKMEFI